MSYNKLKSLVANVEAIKTALQIHIQGRQATTEEKEILSLYSGFGGIKEVLNIGTEKPVSGDMVEPIQRLQELIDTYPHFTEPMRHKRHGGYQSLRPDSVLHPEIPCSSGNKTNTHYIQG